MRKLFISILIAITIVTTLLTLSLVVAQRKERVFDDEALRQAALSRGMKSNPKTFEELIKILPQERQDITKKKVELGKELFFDSALSKSEDVSCSTCHSFNSDKKNNPHVLLEFLLSKDTKTTDCMACHQNEQSGVDRFINATTTKELKQYPHFLNTPSILNASLAKHFGWDGKFDTMTDMIEYSLSYEFKNNITQKELEEKLLNNESYRKMFDEAFTDGVSYKNAVEALDSYMTTLLTRSSYDRFLDGNNEAMSDEAKAGLANFMNFGCKGCHTGRGVGGQTLQKFPLRRLSRVHDVRLNIQFFPTLRRLDNDFPFENRGDFLGKNEEKLYRVPQLRNVSKTSPYFHNGEIMKIRDAVNIMAKHQLGLNLSNVQVDEIVAFLRSLDGELVDFGLEDK